MAYHCLAEKKGTQDIVFWYHCSTCKIAATLGLVTSIQITAFNINS